MAESTLSITLTDIRRHVCRFLGYGSDYTVRSAGEQSQMDDCINRGLRQFYAPPLLPNERTSWVWSFMKPLLRIGLVAGQDNYDLPDDFGGFINSRLNFAAEDNAWFSCQCVSDDLILRHRMQNGAVDAVAMQPQEFATTPLPTDGTTPQRWGLMLWPVPRSTYTLVGPYYCNPYALSATTPYPLGGQPHSDTLLESCLAAAETLIDDTPGIHKQQFMERLMASASLDRELSIPKSFGQNDDRGLPANGQRYLYNTHQAVTYNGNSF